MLLNDITITSQYEKNKNKGGAHFIDSSQLQEMNKYFAKLTRKGVDIVLVLLLLILLDFFLLLSFSLLLLEQLMIHVYGVKINVEVGVMDI